MDILLCVAVLLAFTPVLIAFLHIHTGLTLRANFLLGRLDTVRLLVNRDGAANLYYQVIELFDHVGKFASTAKFQQMEQVTTALNNSGADAVFKGLYSQRTQKWAEFKLKFVEYLRYVAPALFLSILYLAGFLFILSSQEFSSYRMQAPQWMPLKLLSARARPSVPAYLVYAFLGSFVFNTGIMVRRICVWDVSGQMFWWAVYRVVLSMGLAAVLNKNTKSIDDRLYFLVAAASVSILDVLTRKLRAKLFQSDEVPKQNELSLQLIQGIDYWKEQRFLEEGIESIQHLATADFVLLALHTRTPLFTVMDWVDQAVFIQRFPGKAEKMQENGLPVSALELSWAWQQMRLHAVNRPDTPATRTEEEEAFLKAVGEASGTKPEVIERTLTAWGNDNQVQMLTLFWRADLGSKPESGRSEPIRANPITA